MADLFLEVVNLSVCVSWLIAAIIAIRFLLRKTSKRMRVLLWGLVAFRLICPFTLESALSLVPRSVSSGDVITAWVHRPVKSASSMQDQLPEEDKTQGALRDQDVLHNESVQNALTHTVSLLNIA